MNTQLLKTGVVYYLEGFTAPKVFNGLYFVCLSTDQKLPAHIKVKKEVCDFKDFDKSLIFKPERFNRSIKNIYSIAEAMDFFLNNSLGGCTCIDGKRKLLVNSFPEAVSFFNHK